MSTALTSMTLGDLVAERASRSRVFEKLGLDYCCGGTRTLASACAERGLDPAAVQAELDGEADPGDSSARDWRAAPLPELIDHIFETHHAFLKGELPRLAVLAEKVSGVHGGNHPELAEVASIFGDFCDEMFDHLAKEEQVLFPMIRRLASGESGAAGHCGGVANPVRVMLHEHDQAGAALARLRDLTSGFTPPADACGSYTALLAGLADVEADTHRHIHLENNILFPRALAL